MSEKKESSSKKRKANDDSGEKNYKGIVRVTEKVQTNYTVMNKKRTADSDSSGDEKAAFKRVYTVMTPKRKKAGRPPSIGSKYV